MGLGDVTGDSFYRITDKDLWPMAVSENGQVMASSYSNIYQLIL